MRNHSTRVGVLAIFLGLACDSLPGSALATVTYNAPSHFSTETEMIPSGKGWGIKNLGAPQKVVPTATDNGIQYHGGSLMGTSSTTIPNVYFIWYGNWVGNSAPNILMNFAANVGASPYYNINSTYTDSKGPVIPKVNFPKLCGTFDNYSQGTNLTDSSIYYIVKSAITSNALPLDANGIYFVLTSADVNETSGMCTSYCGWHSASTISNTPIKYAYIGSGLRCPRGCIAGSNTSVSPNNNPEADGMVSVVAHELEEAVTDPVFSGWYDTNSYENADKCAWNFGPTTVLPNGSRYNMTIGSMNYLIQQNWVNANGGYCAQHYP